MTDSTIRLPQDPLGKPLMGYDFDFDMCKVAMYKSNGAGGVEIWDGTVDIDVTGSFYLNTDELETLLAAIQAAVEIIDNFISGSRGLVTEDNSADILTAAQAIQTAVELIDNAISGSEMQVDIVTSALPAGAATSAKQDTLIAALQDQRNNYKYTGFLEDGTDVYIGYEDEDGNYYIELHPSSGLVTFTAGSGGIPATGTWTGLTYASFADTF